MELHTLTQNKDREKVELYISCRNLIRQDLASKNDPFVVMSMCTTGGQWRTIGKTEIKWNHDDPDFAKSFVVDFIFERRQWVKLECRDADDPTGSQYDCLGEAVFELGYLVGARNSTLVLDLKEPNQPKSFGKIIARAEPKKDQVKDNISLHFQGRGVAGTFMFLPERAFFTISKRVYRGENVPGKTKGPGNDAYQLVTDEKGEEWMVVYESELSCGPDPSFNEVFLSLSKLCTGDMNAPLKFTLYVSRLCDNHFYKGEFQTSSEQMLSGPANFKFMNKNEYSGSLQLTSSKTVKEYMMLEYLRGGTQMALTVGIDFTASNMDPHLPNSLHYCNHSSGGFLNMYQQAILSVGNILLNYDHDKQVP